MTSSAIQHACAKCNKGAGIATCNGCQRAFCIKHFVEHRQELSQQMDEIGQEHDLLRRDINYERSTQILFERIQQWEQEMIRMVQTSAQQARMELQQVLEQTKNESKRAVDRLTQDIRTCRESDNYTEIEIKKWTEQLREFRRMIEDTSNINIEYGSSTTSAIPLIKVRHSPRATPYSNQERRLNQKDTRIVERFDEIHGNIALTEGGSTARCLGDRWDGSSISGIGRYSSGIHPIRFQIENKISKFLFYGIVTATQNLTSKIPIVKSAYGWWELGFTVIGGTINSESQVKNIQSGDELTLTLNCDNRSIQLQHHRTNAFVAIPIALEQCPFPWKIVVRLDSPDDRIKILQ